MDSIKKTSILLRVLFVTIGIIAVSILAVTSYIFWPMQYIPTPANSECLTMDGDKGNLVPIEFDINHIYGIAMSYSGIINQSGSEYHPEIMPPVFRKLSQAVNTNDFVKYPDNKIILDMISKIEPDMSIALQDKFEEIPVLMDYEVELGIIALEEISKSQLADPEYSPRLAYFLANDLQSLTFGVIGSGAELESKYFDAKGSFPGFLPISENMWVPKSGNAKSTLCVNMKTLVNGSIRQQENTKNRIYSNKEILGLVLTKFNKEIIAKGTAIITGSPAGVANKSARWKRRLGRLLGMSGLDKLSSVFNASKADNKFLQPGDIVEIEAAPFGSIRTEVIR